MTAMPDSLSDADEQPMTEHRPFRFDEHHVVLRLGEGEVLGRDLPGEAHRDGNLVSWDPGVDGLLAGAGTMRRSSSHKGNADFAPGRRCGIQSMAKEPCTSAKEKAKRPSLRYNFLASG